MSSVLLETVKTPLNSYTKIEMSKTIAVESKHLRHIFEDRPDGFVAVAYESRPDV